MKPISVREWEDAIYNRAITKVNRARDKSFLETDLENALADLIEVDVAKERRRRAKEIISGRAKSGATDPAGQLTLPGLDKYFYEPERLVRDDVGHVVENRHSTPNYKLAEARRARDHLQEAHVRSNQKSAEAELFAAWAMDQMTKGRPLLDLTWETCITENALLAA
jgi:hypothetical protein